MYSDAWSPGLRQGDVLGPVPFPIVSGTKVQWVTWGGLTGSGETAPEHALIKTPMRLVIVVSHDCEFNEGKRTHFLVARMDSISARTSPEELNEMRSGNDSERAGREGWPIALDTFYLDPVPGIFDSPMRANFCAISSIPIALMDEAVALKKAEMLHSERVLLRTKIGYFFSRDADDIPEEQKAPPPATE